MRTYVVTGDWQFPFHDKRVIDRLFMPFLEWLRPDGIIWNGDIVDCYDLSVFDKDPLNGRVLNKEVACVQEYGMWIKSMVKERVWLGGNHEDRLRRYLWKNTEKLGLDPRETFQDIFRTERIGFHYEPYGAIYKAGKLDITHGSVVRKHSGWSARAAYDDNGGSIMINHTHRMGVYYKTNSKGTHAAFENGCLCKLDPEYCHNPDWQQGFSVVHVGNRGFYHVQQLPIIERKYMFYGKKEFVI